MKSAIISFVVYLYQFYPIRMRTFALALILLCVAPLASAQNFSWKGYFSYNEIKDISQSPTAIYAASENAIFSKNLATNTLKTTNTIDGLSGETISAIFHSTQLNRTMVGYANGLMIVINDADGTMVNVVDIINKQIAPNIKKVNHFSEFDGIVYVSCDFGIVQYNLATLQFGDTYFIGNAGAEIVVSQTAVHDGFIYAATSSGIRRANITNPNLIDYNQWSVVTAGSWTGIETFGTRLMAINTNNQVHRFNGAAFTLFTQLPLPAVDIRASGDYLIIVTPARIYIYNQALGTVAQVGNASIPEMTATFTCATVIDGVIFIGTKENGIVTTALANPSTFESISPSGPTRNNIWAIAKSVSNLWAVYGGYTLDFDLLDTTYGVSKYTSEGWLNIPYSEVHEPESAVLSLVRIAINPTNENQVFFNSYSSGLIKFENDVLVEVYNGTNSGLEPIVPVDPKQNIRTEQGVFDSSGNLWMTNAIIEKPLKVFKKDGTWVSYNLNNILTGSPRGRFGKMAIDKNNTKWMCTYADGLVGFNENGNISKKINRDNSDFSTNHIKSVAVDKRNQLWIGSVKGLRVLSSVDRFLSDGELTVNPIIILEDGVAQELLYEQFITDIVVDGANQKWIGTSDSGVFLLSPNGQETIHHFTIDNSPLPSNSINDIDIDAITGEVFFATSKGMISFKGMATDPSDNLNNVIVYPNPVRPGYSGTVKITGLLDRCTIKITDIEGSLVYETTSEGGTIEWDTTAFGKYKVASGVYMIFISAEDGVETKVKKVMIVR